MCAWIGGDEDMTCGVGFVCVCVERKDRTKKDVSIQGMVDATGTPIRDWYPRFI